MSTATPEISPEQQSVKRDDLQRRTWVYVQRPATYEISGCNCGNNDPDWSEFIGHLWCQICRVDFVPEHNGIFDGPISVNVCRMLGIVFDCYNLETNEIELFDCDPASTEEPTNG